MKRQSPRSVLHSAVGGLALLLLSAAAMAVDVPGSADYPKIGRFKGSEITKHAIEDYGRTTFATGSVKKASDAESTTLTVEGKITRIVYRVPAGVSALEVFRNFEEKSSEAGFESIFSGGPKEIDKYNFLYKHPVEILDEISIGNEIFYLVSKKNIRGIDVYLSVLVSPHSGGDGQRVRIIAAETTSMKLQMVDADKMQLAITETGRAALYGIYFDHDSAKIQAASKPTLDEIAKLMTTNPALKIIVVGHTDYTGGFDYNIDLSKRRANAVAEHLISGYGLVAGRIKSDGVGYLAPAASNESEAGRALNRRVELVKDK